MDGQGRGFLHHYHTERQAPRACRLQPMLTWAHGCNICIPSRCQVRLSSNTQHPPTRACKSPKGNTARPTDSPELTSHSTDHLQHPAGFWVPRQGEMGRLAHGSRGLGKVTLCVQQPPSEAQLVGRACAMSRQRYPEQSGCQGMDFCLQHPHW